MNSEKKKLKKVLYILPAATEKAQTPPFYKLLRCVYYRKSAGEGFFNLPDQIQYSKLVGGKKFEDPIYI